MLRQLNEAERHGLAAVDTAPPERADWTIDQGWERYTAEEHGVWKTLFQRQSRLLPGRACDEFVQGMKDLPIGADRIPDFRRLSEVLMKRTGWQVVAVPGLVPDDVFFEHLANRRFPSGQFIRKPHQLDYLEEPDVFHDGDLLFECDMLPVCTPALARDAVHPLRNVADLAHHVRLDYETLRDGRLWSWWDIWFDAMELDVVAPAATMRFAHYDQVVAGAFDGSGVAMGARPHLARHMRDGLLCAPFGGDAAAKLGTFFIVVRPDATQRDAAHAFAAWLHSEARADSS